MEPTRRPLLSRLPLAITVTIWLSALALLWALTSTPQHFAGNLVASYLLLWGLIFVLAAPVRALLIKRFVLTTTAIALTVGVLELLAATSLVDYRSVFRTPIFAPWRNPRYVLDPELVHVRRPHERITGFAEGHIAWLYDIPVKTEYHLDVHCDRNGFRNEHDLEKADIAMLGDSFVEGLEVAHEELATSVLGRLQKCAVLNLGLIGYGPQQELAALKRFALPVQPKVVVWMFFEGNDLKNVHSYNALMSDWSAQSQSFHSFPERSFTKNALSAAMRRFGKPKPPAPAYGDFRTSEGKDVRMYFLYPGSPLSAEDLDALRQTRAILAAAHECCASQGVKLVVVFVPTKFRVYNGLLRYDAKTECLGWVLNDLPERFRAAVDAISDQIGYIDLTSALSAGAKQGRLLYFLDDSHWSAEGHRIAAEVMNDHLIEQAKTSAGAAKDTTPRALPDRTKPGP